MVSLNNGVLIFIEKDQIIRNVKPASVKGLKFWII